MKVFDTVNNVELEADTKKLVDIMVDGRQVDVYLKEKKSDEDGYMSWGCRALVSNRLKSVSSAATLWKAVSSASLLVTTSMILYNEFKPEDAFEK